MVRRDLPIFELMAAPRIARPMRLTKLDDDGFLAGAPSPSRGRGEMVRRDLLIFDLMAAPRIARPMRLTFTRPFTNLELSCSLRNTWGLPFEQQDPVGATGSREIAADFVVHVTHPPPK